LGAHKSHIIEVEVESQHVEIARTCSNLVADWFAVGLSQIPLCYPARRPAVSWNLAYHALSSSLAAS